MASRNMEQIAAKAKVPDRYNMKVSELFTLMDKSVKGKEGLYQAITQAFYFGFVLGERATKAKAKLGGKV